MKTSILVFYISIAWLNNILDQTLERRNKYNYIIIIINMVKIWTHFILPAIPIVTFLLVLEMNLSIVYIVVTN